MLPQQPSEDFKPHSKRFLLFLLLSCFVLFLVFFWKVYQDEIKNVMEDQFLNVSGVSKSEFSTKVNLNRSVEVFLFDSLT